MQNSPSKTLFNQVKKQGLDYINQVILDKQAETYYLDFKVTEKDDYTNQKNLFPSDKKNFAKAISAFGNSEGGLLIWGIKTGKGDADFAEAKQPIKNVSNFLSRLEGFTSLLTVPPHTCVSHHLILEESTSNIGYIVTHIPKSNQRPHQVIADGDFRYYLRAGSSSLPASDTFLRSLFGQEPQPNVFMTWGVGDIEKMSDGTITFQARVILHNRGENIAKNINGYLAIGGGTLGIQITNQTDFDFSKSELSGLKIGYVTKPSFILGIEQEVQPLLLTVKLKPPFHDKSMQIRILTNASNQMSYKQTHELSSIELQEIYDKYIKDNSFNIAKAIFEKNELINEHLD